MHVQSPLVLRKTAKESAATILKDVALAVGVDIRGWRQLKRRFKGDLDSKLYDLDGTGGGERLAAIVESSRETMAFYKPLLSAMTAAEFEKNAQARTMPVLRELLPQIKSAVSVGCCYAKAEAILASEVPTVHWHCLDFMPDLAEQNRDIARNNMSFHAGYPLDWIKAAAPFDLALFNRVLCVMSPAEVSAYLTTLREKCRFIVFGEQTKLHTYWRGINLDRVKAPKRVRLHYVYNWRALMEEHGFRMIHYEGRRSALTREHGPQHCVIIGVAERK
ncbi:MAG: hypothetical protein ACREIP_05155 [Alphaproteobacteria bacterium]